MMTGEVESALSLSLSLCVCACVIREFSSLPCRDRGEDLCVAVREWLV